MSTKTKAVILDWDTTSADPEKYPRNGLPEELEGALIKLRQQGWLITFNTTRDPIEMIDVLGSRWREFMPPGTLMGLENGGRTGYFLDDKQEVEFHDTQTHQLSVKEIELLCGVLESNDSLIIKFYTGDYHKGQLAWTPNPKLARKAQETFRLAARILSSPVKDLQTLLISDPPVYFALHGEAKLPPELEPFGHAPEYYFNAKGVNKDNSLRYLIDTLKLDESQLIVAGDSSPDIPMLEAAHRGTRVIVGDKSLINSRSSLVRVGDAQALGKYLLDEVINKTNGSN